MHKRDHIARARSLIDTGDDLDLRYAALELRLAMEVITYDKLRAYSQRLPQQVLDRWQPPQAIKALLQFEPGTDREYVLRISKEDADGVPGTDWRVLGQHRSFSVTWLRTAYNKLGSYLHLPSPSKSVPSTEHVGHQRLRESLIAILEEVERVASSSIDGTMAVTVSFECAACDRLILINEAGLKMNKRAVCLESSCAAEHVAIYAEDDSVEFLLDATEFDCLKCGGLTPVENRHLAIGLDFQCSSCQTWHRLVSKEWGYAIRDEAFAAGP